VAANHQTKLIDLGCESAENWQLPSTSTIAIVIITQPVSSLYCPTEGGRLSRPRHCSRSAQPMPKAAYRSSCRDKQPSVVRFKPGSSHTAVRYANHLATATCSADGQCQRMDCQKSSFSVVSDTVTTPLTATVKIYKKQWRTCRGHMTWIRR